MIDPIPPPIYSPEHAIPMSPDLTFDINNNLDHSSSASDLALPHFLTSSEGYSIKTAFSGLEVIQHRIPDTARFPLPIQFSACTNDDWFRVLNMPHPNNPFIEINGYGSDCLLPLLPAWYSFHISLAIYGDTNPLNWDSPRQSLQGVQVTTTHITKSTGELTSIRLHFIHRSHYSAAKAHWRAWTQHITLRNITCNFINDNTNHWGEMSFIADIRKQSLLAEAFFCNTADLLVRARRPFTF